MSNTEHSQYGNNFYLLFAAVKMERTHRVLDIFEQLYVSKAENLYGTDWSRFLSENSELIDEICIALEGAEMYSNLLLTYRDLLINDEWEKAEEFEARMHLAHIGISAWNTLNPLLEKAGKIMARYGIDEHKFWS